MRLLRCEKFATLPDGDFTDEFGFATGEVVEELALARERRRTDGVESGAADAGSEDLATGRLDDALASGSTAFRHVRPVHGFSVPRWTKESSPW